MSFLVTANTPILCPLCRRFNLNYDKDIYTGTWKFFCPNCKVNADLGPSEIRQVNQDNFANKLREKLAAALGRANKLEPVVQSEGPNLRLAPGQEPSPLARKRRNPPKPGRIDIPPYEEPNLPKLWDRKKNPNKRVQQRTKIRQALQRAQRTIVEEEDE